MPRQKPPIQGIGQRKVLYLGVDERVQLITNRTSPQKIGSPALDFPGTRSAKDKPDTEIFDQPMDLVEQGGNFLYFVDNDRKGLYIAHRVIRQTLLTQDARVAQEPLIFTGEKQIVTLGAGEKLLQQGALAGLPRPPQKTGFPVTKG
jgi:hypothetical protein